MAEDIHSPRNLTMEQARNAAVAWMEQRLKEEDRHVRRSGGRDQAERLRLGQERGESELYRAHGGSAGQTRVMRGRDALQTEIRLDIDEKKGPHYNAVVGEGARRKKRAFPFLPPRDVIPRAVSDWCQYTPAEQQIARAWLDRVIRHRR
jgi:hypothetical protein